MSDVVGRFAPSPTGPLHFGSLVAATGSWLFARKAGGRWLVRMEDLDRPRVVEGSADEILFALERYGLTWDGAVESQSTRLQHYADAVRSLRERDLAFDCACSRADLQRAASAPAAGDLPSGETIYPGTCRGGIAAGKTARAVRFRAPSGVIAFDDAIVGQVQEDVAKSVGDFVILRADGVYAYQLAVVVDDAAQGVTQVVRGGDLLSSTARQIALQGALRLPTPQYAHLPLIVTPDGKKLGKRDGALPLPTLARERVVTSLRHALAVLGMADVEGDDASALLADALTRFDPALVPRGAVTLQPL